MTSGRGSAHGAGLTVRGRRPPPEGLPGALLPSQQAPDRSVRRPLAYPVWGRSFWAHSLPPGRTVRPAEML